jgi:hypothetical protein
MSNLMYQSSAAVFLHQLKNLAAILKKAEKDAKARGIEESVILNARLAPDMLPLTSQIQMACDQAKGSCARLTGTQAPAFADDEASFAQLQARIKKTTAFLRTMKKSAYAGSEDKDITMELPFGKIGFNGADYLNGWVLPNFYFHYSNAYSILRHNGLSIGKIDFLGMVPGMTMSGQVAKRLGIKSK